MAVFEYSGETTSPTAGALPCWDSDDRKTPWSGRRQTTTHGAVIAKTFRVPEGDVLGTTGPASIKTVSSAAKEF